MYFDFKIYALDSLNDFKGNNKPHLLIQAVVNAITAEKLIDPIKDLIVKIEPKRKENYKLLIEIFAWKNIASNADALRLINSGVDMDNELEKELIFNKKLTLEQLEFFDMQQLFEHIQQLNTSYEINLPEELISLINITDIEQIKAY